jgi:aspartyl-tRNA(Asn)/glutamyl-tRNA(Gln) amidotransferase subunit B
MSSNDQLVKTISNIICTTLLSLSNKYNLEISDLIDKDAFLEVAKYYHDNKINNQGLNLVLEKIIENKVKGGKEAVKLIESLNILQIDDESVLTEIAQSVILEFPTQVEQYKSGKTQVIGFLLGLSMKKSNGKGNPAKIKEILIKLLA